MTLAGTSKIFPPLGIASNIGIAYDTNMNKNIVLDTNVLLTALNSSRGTSFRLLAGLADSKYQLHVSTPLVVEYEAVLKRGHLSLSEEQIDDIINFICAQATHHQIFYLWRPALKDPDDDFILELAFKAGASIVTWNTADFKRADEFAVKVFTPREFLAQLETPI